MKAVARRASDPGRASGETNLKPSVLARENNGARVFIAVLFRWQRVGGGDARHVHTDPQTFTAAVARGRRAFVDAYHADNAGRLGCGVQWHLLRCKAVAWEVAKHFWQRQQTDNSRPLLRQGRCSQKREASHDTKIFHIQGLSVERLPDRLHITRPLSNRPELKRSLPDSAPRHGAAGVMGTVLAKR